jgi:hypothetical protein
MGSNPGRVYGKMATSGLSYDAASKTVPQITNVIKTPAHSKKTGLLLLEVVKGAGRGQQRAA